MSKTSLLDIQKGIYDKLTGDTTLMALITGVFDEVPKDQALPFVNIGEATENKFNTFDRIGRDVTETINIYSEYDGFKEALDILDRIIFLLDFTTITLTGHDLVYIRYEGGDTLLLSEDEGRTKHIRSRFAVLVQQT